MVKTTSYVHMCLAGVFPCWQNHSHSSTVSMVSTWQVCPETPVLADAQQKLISDSEVAALAARYARQSVKILSQES